MNTVKTYTGPDSYGGTGLFAAEDIPAGTIVWIYHPDTTRFITVEEFLSATGVRKKELEKYSYPGIDPTGKTNDFGLIINLDNSRYTNHSYDPNTGNPDGSVQRDIALCTIRKGEEITSNYLTYDPEQTLEKKGITTCISFLLEDHNKKTKNLA